MAKAAAPKIKVSIDGPFSTHIKSPRYKPFQVQLNKTLKTHSSSTIKCLQMFIQIFLRFCLTSIKMEAEKSIRNTTCGSINANGTSKG